MSCILSALNRRRFVEHLLRSPLVLAGTIAAQSPTSRPPIASFGEALNVFDFVPLAQKEYVSGHWAYLMTKAWTMISRATEHNRGSSLTRT
jgi:hypothetical protein